jgi:hypothetical protein
MSEKLSIIYVQTPFQWSVAKRIIEQSDFSNQKWWVVCNPLMSGILQGEDVKFKLIAADDLEVKFSWSLMSHIRNRNRLVHGSKLVRESWQEILKSNEVEKLFFFSEKNVFVQLLLKEISSSTEVWCVDEGTAIYINSKYYDFLLKAIYSLVTPFLIGFNYEFFRVHGTHRRIDFWLVRLPHCMNMKGKEGRVKGFDELGLAQRKVMDKTPIATKRMLILFSTFSEDSRKSVKEESELIHQFVEIIVGQGWSVVIKPHPRERNLHKYDSIQDNPKVMLLNGINTSEVLDYADFGGVVNFYSSSVIDLLDSGYSASRIFTFDVGSKLLIPTIFGLTHEIKFGDWSKFISLLNE